MELRIIEAPSNLGLKATAPPREPGVRKLPAWLIQHGLLERLSYAKATLKLVPPPYTMDLDAEAGVRNTFAIAAFTKTLAQCVSDQVQRDIFALVLGGDCSILMGCMAGLRTRGRYGLFFMDGHTDFMLPSMSRTGGAAGMDLAIVTGHGHSRLTDIDSLKPYVQEQHVMAFGNRYMASEYVAAIAGTNIDYADLGRIRREGVDAVVQCFLAMVSREQLDGFWIHLDVDVLDDVLMPCVDSRQPDGLSYEELTTALKILMDAPGCKGIDVTILDPDLDDDGRYTKIFVEHLAGVIKSVVKG